VHPIFFLFFFRSTNPILPARDTPHPPSIDFTFTQNYVDLFFARLAPSSEPVERGVSSCLEPFSRTSVAQELRSAMDDCCRLTLAGFHWHQAFLSKVLNAGTNRFSSSKMHLLGFGTSWTIDIVFTLLIWPAVTHSPWTETTKDSQRLISV